MAAKKQTTPPVEIFPLLKTVEQMSKINGNRRLLCENAIWDWYNRNKVPVRVAREA